MNFALNLFSRVSAVAVVGFLSTGCGGGTSQLIKDFKYTFSGNTVDLVAEFNAQVALNVEVEAPVKNYGTIRFIPADGVQGFRIGAKLNMDVFVDPDVIRLGKTTTLPNGTPFPAFVKTELHQLRFQKDPKWAASGYFGTVPNHQYVGAGMELSFIGANFPEGLVVSQPIVNRDKKTLGVVAIYGPKMKDGQVEIPGGVFLVTNLSDLRQIPTPAYAYQARGQSSVPLYPVDTFDVHGKDAHRYRSDRALLGLFRTFQNSGRASGVID